MTDETITERKDGVTVHIETKRGTGTRDQDKVSVTAHYDSLPEAFADRELLKECAEVMAYELRQIQPEEPEDKDADS
jgi:hypothetical protein